MGGCESLVDQLQGASVSYRDVTTLVPVGIGREGLVDRAENELLIGAAEESAVSDRVSQEAGVKKGVGILPEGIRLLVDVTKDIEDSLS